jgi:hypothetical protein
VDRKAWRKHLIWLWRICGLFFLWISIWWLLEEGMSVQRHTNGIDECDIDPEKPFINWMITELSGTDGEKSIMKSSSWFLKLISSLLNLSRVLSLSLSVYSLCIISFSSFSFDVL